MTALAAAPSHVRRLNTTEAATEARKHRVTILLALEDGTLHGSQRKVRGRWTILEPCLDAYIDGRKCEHQVEASRPASNVIHFPRSA